VIPREIRYLSALQLDGDETILKIVMNIHNPVETQIKYFQNECVHVELQLSQILTILSQFLGNHVATSQGSKLLILVKQ
jgi:hypothetical protein